VTHRIFARLVFAAFALAFAAVNVANAEEIAVGNYASSAMFGER